MTYKIESSSNKQIKWIKSLSQKKARWKEKSFIVEGIRSVEQALKSGCEVELIAYSDRLNSNEKGQNLLSQILSSDISSICIEDRLFSHISDTENPQGVLAAVKFHFKTIEDSLKEKENFFVLLDRVQDPGNMGTIIRTAEALGSNGIIVSEGCVDVYNSKTVRSTMGAILDIPIIYCESIEKAILELKTAKIRVISSSLETENQIYDLNLKKDIALVVGNEANGISAKVTELSDELAKIPMKGKAESLNAGVASGIFMYEVLRQRLK